MKELVILKLGGSLITEKDKPFSLRREVIEGIGRELKEVSSSSLIIVHGGGSYAHPVAKRYKVFEGHRSLEHLKGFIETAKVVRQLNNEVVEILVSSGFPCIGIPASTFIITKGGRIVTCNLDPFFSALELGVTPVTCGDAVFDREMKFTILSGDTIASYLSIRLKARRLIYALDVDGVYIRDRVSGEIKLAERLTPGMPIELFKTFEEDVTGGIIRKIEEGFTAVENGVEVILINGLDRGKIRSAILGEEVIGTRLVF
ncbi:MAG: isopentenyl phosphate kinase [Aigarchaeota archaeon]|nr:isopentenyl phosphate kinase [Aigarchaeota archaeon]MCX8193199.1 isopentenyl phosphate kinase [Nitrososphaeria archaeon]MDW7986340.1 isopentenyl phosphate kinase [Nitrososphaerota archaeon]